MSDLHRLAVLIKSRNAIDAEIGSLIGRPALMGHIGEYIAAEIFGINLELSASYRSIDGRFTSGTLAGRTVNIKWYGKREGLLDLALTAPPEYYLVITGPRASAASSRKTLRPCLISSVFLFDSTELINVLRNRGVKIGTATSVSAALWDSAEIYPLQRTELLSLSDAQRSSLKLFG